MEDTSFIDLLREENLSRINIDPRLIDAFKNVKCIVMNPPFLPPPTYHALQEKKSYSKGFRQLRGINPKLKLDKCHWKAYSSNLLQHWPATAVQ